MVETRVLKVDPEHPDREAIRIAADTLLDGRLVAFPTETVYGLGANALDAAAIDRIYEAKQRPANDPIIAHIHDLAEVNVLAVNVPPVVYQLAEAFWPGPLTVVLYRAPNIPANIAAGLDTIAVRMPSHPVARALLTMADIPVAAPSANTFTRPSATTAAHVLEDLQGRVDVVLDGGPTTIGLESTVIDLTGARPVALRPGGAVLDDLRAILPDLELTPRYVEIEDRAVSSPGQMVKHYSPRASVTLFSGERDAVLAAMQSAAQTLTAGGRSVGVLAADEESAIFEGIAAVVSLGQRDDLTQISRNLFAAMRELDARGIDVIFVRDYGREGLGAALWDRLLRAAEGKVVTV